VVKARRSLREYLVSGLGPRHLICARGLLAAGMTDEVRQVLETFGRFEDHGTLPNTIFGEDASNRDTSDAPLWYGVVCEELADAVAAAVQRKSSSSGEPSEVSTTAAAKMYGTVVDQRGRTIADILRWIAAGYRDGTPNGIKMDPGSGLIWSPSHFTWMDTNHPAATPREGYPIEIQVLWIRLLRQLSRLGEKSIGETWAKLAERAEESFQKLFWLEDKGWFADVLLAKAGQRRARRRRTAHCAAIVCSPSALAWRRTNGRGGVSMRRRVPGRAGAVRSLAPLPVSPPLPVHASDGQLLNDPDHPYAGQYKGTRTPDANQPITMAPLGRGPCRCSAGAGAGVEFRSHRCRRGQIIPWQHASVDG
jgi:hypothetical protein